MTASTELPGHFVDRSGFLRPDQRSEHRKQTFKFGIVTCGANRRILSVVTNISPTGALIEVENALEIPDEFTLTIESELSARVCCVAWKKAKQIAVAFNGAPRAVTPEHQEQGPDRTSGATSGAAQKPECAGVDPAGWRVWSQRVQDC